MGRNAIFSLEGHQRAKKTLPLALTTLTDHSCGPLSAGVANHSGEEVNDTLYGIKLQDELGDVRFRNIWIKKI